jgi:hypothetical protein
MSMPLEARVLSSHVDAEKQKQFEPLLAAAPQPAAPRPKRTESSGTL